MQPRNLLNRVEMLERKMEGLETLPDRVASLDGQIVQFREETRAAFSAIREEMREEIGRLATREEMYEKMHEMRDEPIGRIIAGDEDTRTQMRVLHEDVISRIALLGEQLNGGNRPTSNSSRQTGRRPSKKAR